MKKRYHYALTIDCVIFGYSDEKLSVALIKRKNSPFKGKWALPGGFVEGNETVEQAAARELCEETGIKNIYLEQFHVFSEPKRDPRERIISVAFFALVDSSQIHLFASEDAVNARWWPAHELPKLSFDHEEIYSAALDALRRAMNDKPILFNLLPKEFTLSDLQKLYEQVFETSMDKRNFRKKIASMPYIKPTGKMRKGKRHRPAQLFRFNQKKFE